MTGLRLLLVALMALSVLVSGCGRKGDLEPPKAALIEAR
jgi:predicted small lipoprotein YifL